MATSAAEIEFVPDAEVVDFVPDEPAATATIDFVPDEVVAQEAQRASTGAVQALDVMAAPRQLDWSGANEKMDQERFYESESLRAQAALNPEQSPALLEKARQKRQDITPYTSTGQRLNQQELSEQRGRVDAAITAARPNTPSSALTAILGPGVAPTVMPVVEAAARSIGGAAGGAAGAALGAIATAGTGGVAPLLFGLGSAVMGSIAGAKVQEEVLQSTETPEETIARQQRAAEDFEENPTASRIGAAAASLPFFGLSLAQIGRAATGDRGAMRNLLVSGGIGASAEYGLAKFVRGEDAKPEDIAAAFFSNMLFNEPTKLGRRMGLQPSSEQVAREEAQAKYGEQVPPLGAVEPARTNLSDIITPAPERVRISDVVPERVPLGAEVPEIPIGESIQPTEQNAQQISETGTPDGGVRAPEVPQQNEPLPTNEGGEGVQSSGQGEPLAEGASEASREVVPLEEATPSNPPTQEVADLPGATSNKEAVRDAERYARGLDPVVKDASISHPETLDNAFKVLEGNPNRPQEIILELNQADPHKLEISLENEAVLLVERAKLNKLHKDSLARAADPNRTPIEQAAALDQFKDAEAKLNALDQAETRAGSSWGRFGAFRRRLSREDFTLEPLLQRARIGKGEALTRGESAQVKTISEDVAAKQTEADAAIAKAEEAQVAKGVDETITQITKQPDDIPAPLMQRFRDYMQRVSAAAEFQANKAEEALRAAFEKAQRLGATPSAPDPILGHVIDLAFAKVVKGAANFGTWSADMVSKWGSRIEPYLQTAWTAATAKANASIDSFTGDKKTRAKVKQKALDAGQQQARVSAALAERIKEGESLDNLGSYVDRLVDSFVKGGVRDRNTLVAAVKGVLEPLSPGITDRKVAELIAEYGKFKPLSKDPLKVIKRVLKGQLLQVSKLEALAAKEPLKKTGPERRTPSDEERRLIRQVNEAKKAAGVVTTDPETQLKSTMDSARTRFANEIKDLTLEIETGQKPPTRTPIEYNQDIQIMRGLRDRLKATVRDLDNRQGLTEEQRIHATTRGLQDSIASLEQRIAGVEPKARRAASDTPEIRALKAKRDALRTELEEINGADALLKENRKAEALVRSIERAEVDLAGPASRPRAAEQPESQLVTEARAQLAAVREQLQAKRDADPIVQQERMDAAEAAVEKSIKKLDEQLRAGDISVKRAPTRAGSQRLEDLRMQRDAMVRLRNQLRQEARPKPNPLDVAIKARKSQLARQEADYQARIAAEDFAPRTRKPPLDISGDKAAMDALARVQKAKAKFTKLQEDWKWGQLTSTERAVARIWTGWEATKNAMFSFDLSAPLQLAFAMAAHPIKGVKAIGAGAKAFGEQFFLNSQKFADREMQKIANSPNYKNGLMREAGLDLTVDSHEENAGSVLEKLADLNSRWAGLPTIVKGVLKMEGKEIFRGAGELAKAAPKVYGKGIKASNVAYNVMANRMRAQTFDAIINRWYSRRGVGPTKDQLKLIGELVNVATGRGGIKGEKTISKILYAPNYYMSLVKQLSAYPLLKAGMKHQGTAAREIFEEYLRAASTVVALQGLVWLFGNRNKQTLDPRSSKFGRAITDRGTQIDATMGRGAYITLISQLLPDFMGGGKGYDQKGHLVKRDRLNTLLSFARGRLSREITTGLTVPSGKGFMGEDQTASEILKDQLIPLSWRDFNEVIRREGMTKGSFIQLLNLIGASHKLSK